MKFKQEMIQTKERLKDMHNKTNKLIIASSNTNPISNNSLELSKEDFINKISTAVEDEPKRIISVFLERTKIKEYEFCFDQYVVDGGYSIFVTDDDNKKKITLVDEINRKRQQEYLTNDEWKRVVNNLKEQIK